MTKNSPGKKATSFRLPPYAQNLLARMAKGMELTKTAVVVQALRALAKREGFDK